MLAALGGGDCRWPGSRSRTRAPSPLQSVRRPGIFVGAGALEAELRTDGAHPPSGSAPEGKLGRPLQSHPGSPAARRHRPGEVGFVSPGRGPSAPGVHRQCGQQACLCSTVTSLGSVPASATDTPVPPLLQRVTVVQGRLVLRPLHPLGPRPCPATLGPAQSPAPR